MTGARLLVETLAVNGVDRVFYVPGESYLSVLDALYDVRDRIDTIACRQERGAAMMAEADAKLTGRPGICMVTRGPGATNASAGTHVAFQDSTPPLLFVGQVGRGFRDRDAFQEIDYRRMYGQLAKWVAEIDDASRVPEYVSRAFAVAMSGRPGPVVPALPEDMLEKAAAKVACVPLRLARSPRRKPDRRAWPNAPNRRTPDSCCWRKRLGHGDLRSSSAFRGVKRSCGRGHVPTAGIRCSGDHELTLGRARTPRESTLKEISGVIIPRQVKRAR